MPTILSLIDCLKTGTLGAIRRSCFTRDVIDWLGPPSALQCTQDDPLPDLWFYPTVEFAFATAKERYGTIEYIQFEAYNLEGEFIILGASTQAHVLMLDGIDRETGPSAMLKILGDSAAQARVHVSAIGDHLQAEVVTAENACAIFTLDDGAEEGALATDGNIDLAAFDAHASLHAIYLSDGSSRSGAGITGADYLAAVAKR